MPTLAAFDWIALLVLLASLIMGLWRGLLYELLVLLGWASAFIGASVLGPPLGHLLPIMGEVPDSLPRLVGMTLVFIAAVFAGNFVAWRMRRLVSANGMRPADSTLGGCFGLLRGVAVLLLVATLVRQTPVQNAPWWQESAALHWLDMAMTSLAPILPPLPKLSTLLELPAVLLPDLPASAASAAG